MKTFLLARDFIQNIAALQIHIVWVADVVGRPLSRQTPQRLTLLQDQNEGKQVFRLGVCFGQSDVPIWFIRFEGRQGSQLLYQRLHGGIADLSGSPQIPSELLPISKAWVGFRQ